MEQGYDLKMIMIPEDKYLQEDERKDAKCPIFVSPEFINGKGDKKTAMVLIQGTGAVRAGIWARSVAINDCFENGSMLP